MHNFPILRAIASHSVVWLGVSLTALFAFGWVGGYSAALGGLVSLIPGSLFTLRYFRHSGARAMEQVVKNAYVAELVKLTQMGVGFALVFAGVKPVEPMAVAGGFVVVQLAGLGIASWLGTRKPK